MQDFQRMQLYVLVRWSKRSVTETVSNSVGLYRQYSTRMRKQRHQIAQ